MTLVSRLSIPAVAIAAALIAPPAQSAILTPDTALASTIYDPNYRAENTINGTGLSCFGGSCGHAAYTNASFGNHWTTAGGDVLGAFITWGFNAAVSLSDIYIWNHQSNGGLASNPGYDVTLFDLVLRDAGGAALATFTSVPLAPNNDLRQTFSFGSTVAGVRSVLFTVRGTENPDTFFTGLAEVRFEGSATIDPPPPPQPSVVPLPAGLPLLVGGLAALGIVRRRRR